MRKWNPAVDDVLILKNNHMGFSDCEKESSGPTGALILGLCQKFGTIKPNTKGTWGRTQDSAGKRMYVFDDCNTVDNIDKIVNDITYQPMSLSESNDLAETLGTSLKEPLYGPGDCYTGSSMVQSINNVFWDGYLEEFKRVLKWTNVSKDAHSCYFQASRLITLVHE